MGSNPRTGKASDIDQRPSLMIDVIRTAAKSEKAHRSHRYRLVRESLNVVAPANALNKNGIADLS
jgi:hypothetical protein